MPERPGRATHASFPHHPPPTEREALVLRHRYGPADMALIRHGYIPQGSDDRWFAWFGDRPGGGVLHLIRSWTGSQIYTLDFTVQPDGGALVTGGWVNRDRSVYAGEDAATRGAGRRGTGGHPAARPALAFPKCRVVIGRLAPR